MKTNTIDPTELNRNEPLAIALRLVSRHWFLAYSKLMSMRWQWSDSFPYGATDGQTLQLNRSGIDKLSTKANGTGLIAFLLVHEALHALLGHGWRTSKMSDHKLANVAADYITNAMIKMRNIELRKEVFPLIDGILLDETISVDYSVEQLYRQLQKPQPKPEPQPQPQPQPKTEEENETTEDNDDSNDEQEDDQGSSDDGTDESPESGDSDSPVDNGTDSTDTDGTPVTGDPNTDDDISDFVGTGSVDNFEPKPDDSETVSEVVERIEEANDRILTANEIETRQSGMTGNIGQRVAEQRANESQLSWTDTLREWLTSRTRSGWDSPFNPAVHSSMKLVCAGRRSQSAKDIVLVIDTSGSICQRTYDLFLSEAQEILDRVKPERLHLLSVSHVLCEAVVLESGDMVPASIKGGGGTLFQPAFDYVRDNDIDPDVLVYLTDGWSMDLEKLQPVDYPVLWLSTQRVAKDYPIGDVINIPAF